MTKKGVRHCDKSWALLSPHGEAFLAGLARSRRDHWLQQARAAREQNGGFTVKLFVDFARDRHRDYLKHLKKLNDQQQLAYRLDQYQANVLSLVREMV